MPSTNIVIGVVNRVATPPSDAVIVCGNSGYTLTFEFDSEWPAETTKIARFVWFSKNKTCFEEITFDGNTVEVPILSNTNAVYAGVYAGNLRTTTPAKIVCEPSILCYGQDANMNPGDLALIKGQIAKLVDALRDISVDPAEIRNAVMEYLTKNPPKVTETDPTVPAWAKQPQKPKYTAKEVGAVASNELSTAVNDALAQAKASGEFDGRNGYTPVKGKDYFDGYTPVKGKDYFDGDDYVLTEADKEEIAEMVSGMVETPTPDSGGNVDQSDSVFKGKTASFYGDSLTEVNYHYTKGYHSWVKDLLRLMSYNNYGQSGYTVSNVYSKVNSVTDTADIVFVMCGVNDQNFSVPLGAMGDNTTGTTYGALNLLCALLKQKYPTSIILFITPHYQTKYPHSAGVTSYEVSKAIREVCEKYAIPVYDNFALSGIYSTNLSVFTTDNCHWNDTAHEMVGKNLAKFVTDSFRYVYGNTSGEGDGDTTLTSISATYSGGNVKVGTAVSALTGVVVKANYSDGSTKTVTGYTLSGEIAEGNNVVTVSYGGMTTTFTVVGVKEETGVTLSSISATYSGNSVEVGTAVTALTGITVTAHYSDGSTATVTDYTLSGEITEGSNTITVSYGGKTTTFEVTGVVSNWRYLTADDIMSHVGADDVTVIDGTLYAVNAIGWTIIEFDPSIKEIKGKISERNTINLVYYDQGDGSYTTTIINPANATSEPEIFQMTAGQSGLGSNKTPTWVIGNVAAMGTGVEATITLDENGVVVSINGEPIATIPEGNTFGAWTDFSGAERYAFLHNIMVRTD